MTKMLIPPADLDVVDLGSVFAGQAVEVSDELAGYPADPRCDKAAAELNEAIAAIDHKRAQELRDEIAGLDPGRGLLARGWKLAAKDKTPAAASADDSKETKP